MSIFRVVLDMSLAASIAAAAVILARLALKKAPRVWAYGLWAVVFFRLVCPVTFEGGFGVIPASVSGWAGAYFAGGTAGIDDDPVRVPVGNDSGRLIIAPTGNGETPILRVPGLGNGRLIIAPTGNGETPISQVSGLGNGETPISWVPGLGNGRLIIAPTGNGETTILRVPGLGNGETPILRVPGLGNSRRSLLDIWEIVTAIWLAGITVMLCCGIVGWLRLRNLVKTATLSLDGAYETDRIPAPFVLGFFRPRIYLPVGLESGCRSYVLEHERGHLRRGDFVTKPLAFLALALHWFNPVIWLSFCLMCRDMETSCDEGALRRLGTDARTGYSGALLTVSARQSGLAQIVKLQLSPLAFGWGNTSERVKNVLNYRKPKLWMSVIALLLTAVVTASCVTSLPAEAPVTTEETVPAEPPQTPEGPEIIGASGEIMLTDERLRTQLAEIEMMLKSIDLMNGQENTDEVKTELAILEKVYKEYFQQLNKTQAFVNGLKASITLEDNGLHFTIPSSGAESLVNIWISGRSETEGMGISRHYLTDESENKLWAAGRYYMIPVTAEQAENFTGLSMYIYLVGNDGKTYEYEIDLLKYYPQNMAAGLEPGISSGGQSADSGNYATAVSLWLPGLGTRNVTKDLALDIDGSVVDVVISQKNDIVLVYNPNCYTVMKSDDGDAVLLAIRPVPRNNANASSGYDEKVTIYVPDIRYASLIINAKGSVLTLPALNADIYIKEQGTVTDAVIPAGSKRAFELDSRGGVANITVSETADVALDLHSEGSILTFDVKNKPELPQYTMDDLDYADEPADGAAVKLNLQGSILTLTSQGQ